MSSRRHVGVRRHLPKTARAKTGVVAKTCGRAKASPEDNSGEDRCRREDMWACEGISRRQLGRRQVSSRRHGDVRRHFTKTGRAKTGVIANTRGRAKALPEDRRRRQPRTPCVLTVLGVNDLEVRKPTVVARGRVRTRRHLLTWRQGATWRCRLWRSQMWRQIRASLAREASGSHVRSPHGGVRTWRHLLMWHHGRRSFAVASLVHVASGSLNMAWLDVASQRGVRSSPSVTK